jgi:hypothetical protein
MFIYKALFKKIAVSYLPFYRLNVNEDVVGKFN